MLNRVWDAAVYQTVVCAVANSRIGSWSLLALHPWLNLVRLYVFVARSGFSLEFCTACMRAITHVCCCWFFTKHLVNVGAGGEFSVLVPVPGLAGLLALYQQNTAGCGPVLTGPEE
jgi:hypothetical protein